MKTSKAFALGLGAVLVASTGISGDLVSTAQATEAGDAARGAPLYARNCASCHGVAGKGDGPVARALRPPPTDFSTKPISAQRAYEITKTGGMSAGLAATMPAFDRSMSEQDLRDVAAFVVSLKNPGADGGAK